MLHDFSQFSAFLFPSPLVLSSHLFFFFFLILFISLFKKVDTGKGSNLANVLIEQNVFLIKENFPVLLSSSCLLYQVEC